MENYEQGKTKLIAYIYVTANKIVRTINTLLLIMQEITQSL